MAAEMTMGQAGQAGTVARPSVRLAPTTRWPKPVRKSVPFSGLLLFTAIMLVAPQNMFPALEPLMLAKLSAAFALIPYLISRAMTSRPLTVMTPTVKWGLVLAVIAVLSIPVGYWPSGSYDVFVDLFGKSIIVFLLVANIVDTERRFRALLVTMIACGTFAAINAVMNYAAGNFDPTGQRVMGYDSPLAGNPNDLALTLNILLALSLGLLPVLRHRIQRLLLLAAMGVMLAGIVVSFSRSGFLTLGVLGAMWAARRLRDRGGRAVPSIAIVVFAVALALPAGYSDRVATIFSSESDATGSSEERWQTMMTAAGQMLERPILGYGLGNNVHVSFSRGGLAREAHNGYLKIGAELGIGGMIVFILFIVSALASSRAVRRFFQWRTQGWELGRLAGGVEMALVAFAVGAFFSPSPYHFYVYYPAGLAVAIFAIGARVPASAAHRGR